MTLRFCVFSEFNNSDKASFGSKKNDLSSLYSSKITECVLLNKLSKIVLYGVIIDFGSFMIVSTFPTL